MKNECALKTVCEPAEVLPAKNKERSGSMHIRSLSNKGYPVFERNWLGKSGGSMEEKYNRREVKK